MVFPLYPSSPFRGRSGADATRRSARSARAAFTNGRGALLGAVLALVAVAAAVPAARGQAVPPQLSAAGDTLVLSLPDVRRLVLQQNPSFLAARQETEIARGGVRQARAYQFNPELSLLAPGAGSDGTGSPYEVTLTQDVEWAGQRGLRIGAARHGLARASFEVRNAGRLLLADASVAYHRAIAAQRRLALATEVLGLNERLLGAVRTQLREGEISTLEGNLAEIEVGRARARVLGAQREATSAELELKRLSGLGPDSPLRLADTAPAESVLAGPDAHMLDTDSLVALALARRPDVRARAAATREAETLGALARREAIPNLRLGTVGEREREGGDARFGLAVGLGLPLFNRNQGIVAQRRAEARRAELETRATELLARTQVTDAVRAYRAASDEAAVFETSVLMPAQQNMTLLETAYQAGKVALPTLLLLRNQLLDAELGYWNAWLARREALVALDAATGALSLGIDDANGSSERTPR